MSALFIITLYLYKDKQLLIIQNIRSSIHKRVLFLFLLLCSKNYAKLSLI